jgi:hypothetical protein
MAISPRERVATDSRQERIDSVSATDYQWPPLLVNQFCTRLNTKAVENSCGNIRRANRIRRWISGATIGRAINLSAAYSATGHDERIAE